MCDGFEAITNSTTFFRGVLRLNKDAFKAYDWLEENIEGKGDL